jgi:hypothetical protein
MVVQVVEEAREAEVFIYRCLRRAEAGLWADERIDTECGTTKAKDDKSAAVICGFDICVSCVEYLNCLGCVCRLEEVAGVE